MAGEIAGLKAPPIDMHKRLDPAAADQKLHDVSQLYEEQFLREMMKAMRGTVPEGSLMKVSQGEQIFREQLDQQNVQTWSKQGGLGLQGIIYQQLLDRFGTKMGIKAPTAKPVGPLPLDSKAEFHPTFTARPQGLNVAMERQSSAVGLAPEKLTAPYDSEVMWVHQINPGDYVIQLEHPEGFHSQLAFRGEIASELKPFEPGRKLAAGATLGLLSPDAQSFFWNLRQDGLKTRNPQQPE